MRIAFDATAAVRQYAGVGRFARGLLAGLARIDAHNYYACITTGSPRIKIASTAAPARASWVRLPVPERVATILWQRWGLPPSPAIFAGRPSLYFTPDFALPPVGRVPGVMTVHDLSFLIVPDCADEHLRRYLTEVVPRSARRASAVVAVSRTTAEAVRDRLGVPDDRIHVVPNGVDATFANGAPRSPDGSMPDAGGCAPPGTSPGLADQVRARFGLEPGYLLSVGTLEPRKNYARLLQAFARARSQLGKGASRPLRLVIAGREGWLYEPIFREVARLNLGPVVRFLTRADDSDLALLYRAAGAFVYPSIYEGFGIPPLEAMACGIPVAASTGGAIPEILADAALYFDPLNIEEMAHAIGRVMQDDDLRGALVPRGHARAARYTWERSADAALALFEQIGQ